MEVQIMSETVTKGMLQCLKDIEQCFDRLEVIMSATASETRELNEEMASFLRVRLGDDQTVSRR